MRILFEVYFVSISPDFLERYQAEYKKNPNSRLFAPLAEAYRQMGMLEQAAKICARGTQIHQHFAGGFVAYAKVLIDQENFAEAKAQLQKATEISQDNVLAFHLLGDVCLKLKQPKEALNAFKMLLLLHPEDERAQRAVKKWEFLSAEDFSKDILKDTPAPVQVSENPDTQTKKHNPLRELERILSLSDALMIRNDLERAQEVLIDAQYKLGEVAEIQNRLAILKRKTQSFAEPKLESVLNEKYSQQMSKKQRLEKLLERVNERSINWPL